jgi:hypothetical protein
VTVPLDRRTPSAGTIEIHYALVPRTDAARPAARTIVPNPGGPGQSTILSAGFPHATLGVVANAGHTPDQQQPCGVAMGVDFVEHLRTDPKRCLHAGRPPALATRPPLHAAQLRLPRVHATESVRRAAAVALATLADERTIADYSGLEGTLDALRGGTYVVAPDRVRVVGARVVGDAMRTARSRASRA